MSFEQASTEVACWLSVHPTIELIYEDETESRFEFRSARKAISTFHIIFSPTASKKWTIETDFFEIAPNFEQVKEHIRGKEGVTITSILDYLDKSNPESDEATDDDDDHCADDDDLDTYNPDDFREHDDGEHSFHLKRKLEMEATDAGGKESDLTKRFTNQGSPLAVARLVKDIRNLQKSNGKYGISGSPRGDNLFIWDMKLTDFPKETKLAQDLALYAHRFGREEAILVEMTFPASFPMEPPFVRITRPKFKFLTGHVTIGGSVCMEMLTRSGWSPSNDIEGILVQIRSAIMSDLNAGLDGTDQEYTESEAKGAFQRMVAKYKW